MPFARSGRVWENGQTAQKQAVHSHDYPPPEIKAVWSLFKKWVVQFPRPRSAKVFALAWSAVVLSSALLVACNPPDCTPPTVPTGNPGLASDCGALLAAQHVVDGADTLNWSQATSIDHWEGVTVNGTPKRVTALRLPRRGLSGTLPWAEGRLDQLEELYLSDNQFTGPIPPELGELKNLKRLYLNGNQFTGPLPPELGELVRLERMNLTTNQFTGPIPSKLGELKNLKWLYLSNNQFTGCVPVGLRGVPDNDLDRLGLPDCLVLERFNSNPREPKLFDPEELEPPVSDPTPTFTPIPTFTPTPRPRAEEQVGPTPTFTPTPTPTVPDPPGTVYVTGAAVNLRTGPGTHYPVAGSARAGDRLQATGRNADGSWLQISDPARPDGRLWIYGGLTSLSAASARAHLAAAIPPPPPPLPTPSACGVVPASDTGLVSDCETLLAAQGRLAGGASLNWSDNLPLADWEGVTLGGTPVRVTGLVLYDRDLRGMIPPELGRLDQLTYLNLAHNQLTGDIPPDLGNLTRLEGLWLHGNELSGTIPTELSQLAQLIQMGLHENRLHGEIPSELGQLSWLSVLRLAGNPLTGCIPAGLQNVPNHDLEDLDLTFCMDDGEVGLLSRGVEDVLAGPAEASSIHPNLDSILSSLLARYLVGETTAEEAAREAPVSFDDQVLVTLYTQYADLVATKVAEWLVGNFDVVLRHVGEAGYIEVFIPVSVLATVTEALPAVRIEAVIPPEPAFGDVVSQGVAAHNADAIHADGFEGTGIRVGVIDVGFIGFSALQALGELPAQVQARCFLDRPQIIGGANNATAIFHTDDIRDCEVDTAHGTAVAEAVLDVAPSVSLYIANPTSKGDLRTAVQWMISENVAIINRSLSSRFEGPGDGTSPYADSVLGTVDQAVANGILWVNSVGNRAQQNWVGDYFDRDGDGWIDFRPRDEVIGIDLQEDTWVTIQLRWAGPWKQADTDLNLCIFKGYKNSYKEEECYKKGSEEQTGDANHRSFEIQQFKVEETTYHGIAVKHIGGPAPTWIQVLAWGRSSGNFIAPGPTPARSLTVPAESHNPGLLAVGAAPYWNTRKIQDYSSRGPTTDNRIKPDLVGADCAWSVGSVEGVLCGTSQAAPHVAGLAALALDRAPTLDMPAKLAAYLKGEALDRGDPGPDDTWGQGFAFLHASSEILSAGALHTCFLASNGGVYCWGHNVHGQTDVPPSMGLAKAVDAGGHHTCAIDLQDGLHCWGYDGDGQTDVPPTLGPVMAVAAGLYHTCAQTLAGKVECWGYDGDGQSTPAVPATLGPVKTMDAGVRHTCVLSQTGKVHCWGAQSGIQDFDQAKPPVLESGVGAYASVQALSVGEYHNCVLGIGGVVGCWGSNDHIGSMVNLPTGQAVQVSAGWRHTCAIDLQNQLFCWGDNEYGQTNAPDYVNHHSYGGVTAVAAGRHHTCAKVRNWGVVCWGDNQVGQINVPEDIELARG